MTKKKIIVSPKRNVVPERPTFLYFISMTPTPAPASRWQA
jgi:hypothetical protein